MKTVLLHGKKAAGRVAVVDDSDYGLVMAYRWTLWEQPRSGRMHGPYAITSVTLPDGSRTVIRMHNLITGRKGIDHHNGDGLDNQRSNLRPATPTQNLANQRPQRGTSSRFKGVTWYKQRNKWIVHIQINGRLRYLGYFTDEEAAAHAYDTAALAAWGEFAYLNFPMEDA